MKSPCVDFGCILCCLSTEMLLSDEDVRRIEKLGFNRSYFVHGDDGWLVLNNTDRKCVFHDGEKCKIYESRPEGCKFYPVIFNDDSERVELDTDCPYADSFEITDVNEQGVILLIKKIDGERERRR
jgi:Fe-S-cluster containining protein